MLLNTEMVSVQMKQLGMLLMLVYALPIAKYVITSLTASA